VSSGSATGPVLTLTVTGPSNVGNNAPVTNVSGGNANGGSSSNNVSGLSSTGGSVNAVGGSATNTGSARANRNDIKIRQTAEPEIDQTIKPVIKGAPTATNEQENRSKITRTKQKIEPEVTNRSGGNDQNSVTGPSSSGDVRQKQRRVSSN